MLAQEKDDYNDSILNNSDFLVIHKKRWLKWLDNNAFRMMILNYW